MVAKAFVNGHEAYFNQEENQWRYTDNDQNANENRACIKCDKFPTNEGHDYCMRNLVGIINACCGHGVEEGYLQFEDGRVLRGNFTIENYK
jgi:hypothetical protein